MHPDCAAGTAKPAPTVAALSLKGLQEGMQKMSQEEEQILESSWHLRENQYVQLGGSSKESTYFIITGSYAVIRTSVPTSLRRKLAR